MSDSNQPGLAIAMPAPIEGDGFQAEVDGSEMAPEVIPAGGRIEAANRRSSQGAC